MDKIGQDSSQHQFFPWSTKFRRGQALPHSVTCPISLLLIVMRFTKLFLLHQINLVDWIRCLHGYWRRICQYLFLLSFLFATRLSKLVLFLQRWKMPLWRHFLKSQHLTKTRFKNYRPISNTAFLSKIIEKAAIHRVNKHMVKNNLQPFQSAYKSNSSTETALLKVKSDIMSALDNQQSVFLVLLDLSAAFDTIDHSILLN